MIYRHEQNNKAKYLFKMTNNIINSVSHYSNIYNGFFRGNFHFSHPKAFHNFAIQLGLKTPFSSPYIFLKNKCDYTKCLSHERH